MVKFGFDYNGKVAGTGCSCLFVAAGAPAAEQQDCSTLTLAVQTAGNAAAQQDCFAPSPAWAAVALLGYIPRCDGRVDLEAVLDLPLEHIRSAVLEIHTPYRAAVLAGLDPRVGLFPSDTLTLVLFGREFARAAVADPSVRGWLLSERQELDVLAVLSL